MRAASVCYGATVGQSLGKHLVLGSTVKLLRAGETKGGLDMGAMAMFGRARVGLMVRNVTEPEFDDGASRAFKLRRHARAGAAVTTGSRGVIGDATVAVDADLVKITDLAGRRTPDRGRRRGLGAAATGRCPRRRQRQHDMASAGRH